ncbi:DUF1835 domain-containing protein [Pseudoalteromonas spongiae]|uniref:DUF1835 domain-containing protein n=1 Tax=Pseudoalteromonas spongiae TaxID=298657 RepID=UPI00026CB3DE|nr:DUF1835 domain-containing protein [Pseudoalteromonas spongiae]ATC97880.1 hypothetical protein PSPO_a0693 [Pseudoalteromonas spongiae UST010723-006]
MYHITNGDSANLFLKRIGIQGQFIAWQDVLHHGPISAEVSLPAMSDYRAAFLADYFCLPLKDVRAKFEARNDKLNAIEDSDEVTLWLTPELFDSLIGLQFIAWYRAKFNTTHNLFVVLLSDHLPPRELEASQVAQYYKTRFSPSEPFFELATRVWQALTTDLAALEGCLTLDFKHWPNLKTSVQRFLQEQPDDIGLNRTQWQILDCLNGQTLSLAQLFGANQDLEEVPFMGDLSFWCQIEEMREYLNISTQDSLLHQEIEFYHGVKVSLSEKGQALL